MGQAAPSQRPPTWGFGERMGPGNPHHTHPNKILLREKEQRCPGRHLCFSFLPLVEVGDEAGGVEPA